MPQRSSDSDPDRSSLVAFVGLGASDARNRQPDVGAAAGWLLRPPFHRRSATETSGPSKTPRSCCLDGALVGHHSAFEPASRIDAAGDRGTELHAGQRFGHGQLPPARHHQRAQRRRPIGRACGPTVCAQADSRVTGEVLCGLSSGRSPASCDHGPPARTVGALRRKEGSRPS